MCEDVPSPESNNASRPENGQCQFCHCLENHKCPQCQVCKKCGKVVPFEFQPISPVVIPVPSPYPVYPWPEPASETGIVTISSSYQTSVSS